MARGSGARKGGTAVAAVLLVIAVLVGSAVGIARFQGKVDRDLAGPSEFEPTPEPRTPVVLWVGDSYPEGTGAERRKGYARQTVESFGWLFNADVQGGTGFINDGSSNDVSYDPLIARIQPIADRYTADAMFIDAGRNDGWGPSVYAAAEAYIERVRQVRGPIPLVLIVPSYIGSTSSPYGGEVARGYRRLAASFDDVYVIDPWSEGWMPVPRESRRPFTFKDKVHPSQAGHDYYAEHLVESVRRLGLAKKLDQVVAAEAGS